METLTEKELTHEELFFLGAEDSEFYCRYFFPVAFRQPSPEFHRDIWSKFENPEARYVDAMVFRGGAKTTIARAFTSKRIAYGISRTILFVSETQDHAKRSVRWLKRAVLYNTKWAEFYNLRIGDKKSDEWLEIYHGDEEFPITILAVGITGQTRGVNLDDFRPDLIVIDDPCNEENTATPEARKKTENLVFGALGKSLAPPSDAVDAKMIVLQTVLNGEDLISQCQRDPDWLSSTYSCFKPDGTSQWEDRFSTEFLEAEKKAHINRNQLPLWLREMECKITSEATSSFRAGWLKEWPGGVLPEKMVTYLWIDPVPPPSERQLAMGLKGKDFECIAVVGRYKADYFLVAYAYKRGHEPDWTIATFWQFVDVWRPRKAGVETINYQRTLKWILEQSMQQRGRYIQLEEPKPDRRKKSYRIVDSLTSVSSSGHFFVNRQMHQEFIEQFTAYPDVANDDIIESVSEALRLAQNDAIVLDYDEFEDEDDELMNLPSAGGFAP